MLSKGKLQNNLILLFLTSKILTFSQAAVTSACPLVINNLITSALPLPMANNRGVPAY